MKKTRRGIFLILSVWTLLSVVPLFLGCHGSKGPDRFVVPDEFNTSEQYEITFWAKNDTNKAQTEIYQKAIKDFQQLYPNVHVHLRLYTDYGRIYNDVITNISTNTTPNVCITYPDHIATYLTGANTVVPLNDLFSNADYGLGGKKLRFQSPRKEELIQQFLKECSFDGTYYAVPYMRSTEVCYINQTYVEALGYTLPDILTWDFLFDVSEAATLKDEAGNYRVNGQKVMIPTIYKSTDNMLIQMLRQKGGGYSTESGEILLFNDTTKALLNTIGAHAETGAFSTFKISSYPANFLNAGQCIFAVDSTAGSTWMGSHAPLSDISADKFKEFITAVRPVPQFDPENPQMISQGPSICIFNKSNTQEVLASWLFVQYLLTDDVQIAYAETEGYVPVTSTAQTSSTYKAYLSGSDPDDPKYYDVKIKATKLLLNNIQHTFVTPVFNGSASLRDAAGQLVESVTKSVKRGERVDDAYMNKLFSQTISLYRLNASSSLAAAASGGKMELGPFPTASVLLLSALACAWILMGIYWLHNRMKKKRAQGKP
jgi:multiple sugar transport system substrate-binding protein